MEIAHFIEFVSKFHWPLKFGRKFAEKIVFEHFFNFEIESLFVSLSSHQKIVSWQVIDFSMKFSRFINWLEMEFLRTSSVRTNLRRRRRACAIDNWHLRQATPVQEQSRIFTHLGQGWSIRQSVKNQLISWMPKFMCLPSLTATMKESIFKYGGEN